MRKRDFVLTEPMSFETPNQPERITVSAAALFDYDLYYHRKHN